MKFRNEDGLTLVELVVAMATSSLVFAAAATLLLLGLRINNLTTGTTIRQNKTRTVLTVMERLATEGEITGTRTSDDDNSQIEVPEGEFWQIMEGATVRFSYVANDQAIYVGDSVGYRTEEEKKANTILDGVYASHVVMDGNNVLTLAVETEDGSYTSSVYCRMLRAAEVENDDFSDIEIPDVQQNTDAARMAFIDVLKSQYRLKGGAPNPGLILSQVQGAEGMSKGEYYAQWYITTREGDSAWDKNGWSKDTPWCACFVSWALAQDTVVNTLDYVPMFAEVDGFRDDFKAKGKWHSRTYPQRKTGDIIFFDWSSDDDPDHVGVYLNTKGNYVYTIEGNSAGMVAVRRYRIDDTRIIGYGVLDWKQQVNSGK